MIILAHKNKICIRTDAEKQGSGVSFLAFFLGGGGGRRGKGRDGNGGEDELSHKITCQEYSPKSNQPQLLMD